MNHPKQKPLKDASENKGKGGRKILPRLVFWLFLFSVSTFIVGILILQTRPVKERIRHVIEDVAGKSLHGTLEIGALSGNLLSRICLKNTRVTQEGQLVLSADEICVEYLLPLLFGRVLHIDALRVTGLSVHLVRDGDSTWNLAHLIKKTDKTVPESDEPSTFRADIQHFRLAAGAVAVTDHQEGRKHRLEAIELVASVELGPRIAVKFLQGSFVTEDPSFSLAAIQGEISYNSETKQLSVPRVRLKTEKSDLVLEGDATLSESPPRIDIRSQIHRLALGEILQWVITNDGKSPFGETLLAGRLALSGTKEHLTHDLDLTVDQTSVRSKGSMGVTAPNRLALDISTSVQGLDPASLPIEVLNGVSGPLNAAVRIKAEDLLTASRQGTASIQLGPSRFMEYDIQEGRLMIRFNGNEVRIAEGSLVGAMGRLDLRGTLRGRLEGERATEAKLTLSLHDFAPEMLQESHRLSDLRGRLDVDLEMETVLPPSLDLEKATGQVNMRISSSAPGNPFGVHGLTLEQGDMAATWEKGQVVIQNLDLRTLQGRLVISGSGIPVEKKGNLNVGVEFPSLAPVVTWAQEMGIKWLPQLDMNGRLSISSQVSGTWSDVTVVTKIAGSNLDLAQTTVNGLSGEIGARIYREEDATGLSQSDHLPFGPRQFDISSNLFLEAVASNGHTFPQVRTQVRATADRVSADLDMTHESHARVVLTGAVNQWLTPTKDIVIDRLQFMHEDKKAVNDHPIRIEISDEKLTLSKFDLRLSEATLAVEGQLDRGGGMSGAGHHLKATLTALDLESIPRFWQGGKSIGGVVSGELSSEGPLKRPLIRAQIRMSPGPIYEGIRFSHAVLDTYYQDEIIQAETSIFTNHQESVRLSGSLGATIALQPFTFSIGRNTLHATLVTTGLGLSQLPIPDVSGLTYDGQVDTRLQITGNLTAPKISGQLRLTDGQFLMSKPPLTYNDIQGTVRVLPDRFVIEGMEIFDDTGGQLTLKGIFHHEGFRPTAFDVSLTGTNGSLPFHRSIYVKGDPDLVLSGTMTEPTLEGRLEIREGRVDIDDLFQDQPSEIQIVTDEMEKDGIITITKRQTAPPFFLEGLEADVDISVPRNFWIKGRKKNVELSGTVTLKKAREKSFVLLGAINTVRGSYEFQNRLFNIRRGDVTFIGLTGPNPNLDVEAETRVKDVDIILRITGTAKKPVLNLDSRPSMDQADIVSYLVFGRATGGVTTQQAFKAEEAALSITGNLAAGKLEDILGETFHLDTLSINPGTERIAKGSVSLGKYVTPRVFVIYQQPFEKGEAPELEITYELNRDLGLEAQVGNERTSGVDLIWEHEF